MSVTEMPVQDEQWDGGDEPDEPVQLTFKVGGKKPTASTTRLVGGKIELEGEFAKGQTLVLRVEATVQEVAFVDVKDHKTGDIVGCERRHKAGIGGVHVLDVE